MPTLNRRRVMRVFSLMQIPKPGRPLDPPASSIVEAQQRVGGFCELPALLAQFAVNATDTLAAVGLAADALDDPENRIGYRAFGHLLTECAARSGCAHFGLLAGRIWRIEDLGVVGQLVRHSPTVGDALETLTAYQYFNSGGGLAFLTEAADLVDLGYVIYCPDVKGGNEIHDAMVAGGFNFMRELCGLAWNPADVMLPRLPPADTAPYRNLFKRKPTFASEFSALRFPSHWMQHRIAGADESSICHARQLAEKAPSSDFVQRVFRALRILLMQGVPSGDSVAQMLSMHRRTFNRRLEANGLTFQRVLDQVRLESARQLLSIPTRPLDDIAASLGYSSVTPFMRAFGRWTGMSPSRWRRETAARGSTSSTAPNDRKLVGRRVVET
jgi:AraC-like DNA-binding protein